MKQCLVKGHGKQNGKAEKPYVALTLYVCTLLG